MPWAEILELIGPGLQYNIPRERLVWALAEAERRDRVRCDQPVEHPVDHWLFGSSSTIGAGQAEDVTPVTAPASKAPAR
jgi:hypothetical protein